MKTRVVLHLILSLILVGICSSLASASGNSGLDNTVTSFGPAPTNPVNNEAAFGSNAPTDSVTEQSQENNSSGNNEQQQENLNQFQSEVGPVKDQNDIRNGLQNSTNDVAGNPYEVEGGGGPQAQFAGDPGVLGQCGGNCSESLDKDVIDTIDKKIKSLFNQQVKHVNNFEIAYSGLELLLNQDSKDRGYGLAVRYGAEALGNFLLAKQLKERAELLGNGIEELAQFDELAPTLDDEILLTACQASPELPQCADDFDFGDGGFGIGNISIGGSGQNSVIGPGSTAGTSGDLSSLAADPLGGASKDQLFGGVGSRTVDGNDSLADRAPGAARVKVAQGGGGGGGGGGRAGSPAPPAASRPQSGGRAPSSGITTAKAKYSSSNLKYRPSGGLKGKKSTSKSKGNPFKKFFGNKGRTLDFGRNPAEIGSKNGDIWGRLTKRYGEVNKNNRLVKYKVK